MNLTHLTAGFLLLVLNCSVHAAGLNDTGVTTCYEIGSGRVPCTPANSGDTAWFPGQDAHFGRDAALTAGALPAKIGGGDAGFDYTPLDVAGNVIAIVGGIPASPPACVRDNVSGLIWEVKTPANSATTYFLADTATYAGAVNASSLCGFNTGWRLPTRRELLSIVHYGIASGPSIDVNYFPNTQTGYYWSSDAVVISPTDYWCVAFAGGYPTGCYPQNVVTHVRLVRSGP